MKTTEPYKIGIDVGKVLADRDCKQSGNLTVQNVGRKVPLIKGALVSTKKIVEVFEPENVYIVSRCSESAEERIMTWLEYWGFFSEANILENNVRFCRKREHKAMIAKFSGLTHFVDDRMSCIGPMSSVPYKFLFNPDYEDFEIMIRSSVELKMCIDWQDALCKILDTIENTP